MQLNMLMTSNLIVHWPLIFQQFKYLNVNFAVMTQINVSHIVVQSFLDLDYDS